MDELRAHPGGWGGAGGACKGALSCGWGVRWVRLVACGGGVRSAQNLRPSSIIIPIFPLLRKRLQRLRWYPHVPTRVRRPGNGCQSLNQARPSARLKRHSISWNACARGTRLPLVRLQPLEAVRDLRSARFCTARRTTLANLHVHRSARGLLQGRPDWCAAVGRAVRVHGGLSRHGAPPPRPNPTDSLGFAVQRAAPTPDIGAQHAEKSSCLRQTVLRGPFP